ncbi:MAG: GntR family transcriptional regulator [Chloroflexota bacterium]
MAKLTHSTLNQKAYMRLREMILNGSIARGEQIDERRLAAELDVSRTPLREAIGQLVTEGIIEYRPYKGTSVRTFTAKQVNDLYQVRKALEALAIRLAIPKLSQEHIEKIRQILDDVQQALDREDIEAYNAADRRFHDTIVEITDNEMLVDSLNRLGAQIQMVRTIANRDPHVVERTAKERPLILAALEARDADAAARLMEEHIDGVRRAVVSQIEQLEQQQSA